MLTVKLRLEAVSSPGALRASASQAENGGDS